MPGSITNFPRKNAPQTEPAIGDRSLNVDGPRSALFHLMGLHHWPSCHALCDAHVFGCESRPPRSAWPCCGCVVLQAACWLAALTRFGSRRGRDASAHIVARVCWLALSPRQQGPPSSPAKVRIRFSSAAEEPGNAIFVIVSGLLSSSCKLYTHCYRAWSFPGRSELGGFADKTELRWSLHGGAPLHQRRVGLF